MSTFLNNFFQSDTATMDPIFFSPTTGIPSESKLATYMNRQNVGTPTYGLSSGFSRISLDSPISLKKTQVQPQTPEFIPSRMNSSPSFYATAIQSTTYQQPPPTLLNGNVINSSTKVNLQTNQMSTKQNVLNLQKVAAVVAITGNTGFIDGTVTNSKVTSGIVPSQPLAGVASSSTSSGASLLSGGNTFHITPLNNTSRQQNSIQNESPANSSNKLNDSSTRQNKTPHSSPTSSTVPPTSIIPAGIHQENVGGTIYFYPTANHNSNQSQNSTNTENVTQTPISSSVLYTHPGHIYPGPAANVIGMQPKTQLSLAFFIPDEMRSEIQSRNEISNLLLDSADNINIPIDIDNNYHSLYPLEQIPIHPKLPLPSSTYKATNSTTGIKYCLRRLHGFRIQSVKCTSVVEAWKKLQHSNVVQLREVFSTKAFGDNSLVLAYDYHPASQTLLSKYFTSSQESNGYADPFPAGEARPFSHKSNLQRTPNGPLLSETTLWAIIMQLTAGLRAIHQAGLACRTLDPTKIIVTGKRVRLSFLGISDIVHFDPNQANPMTIVNVWQQEDLTALGKLVLALACRCLQSVQRENVQTSIELVTRQYSTDLRNFILFLFNTTSQRRSVTDLMPMIGARFYTQLDALQSQCDMQNDELAKEMENGRLYRILIKLGCINERPDYNMDVTWAETGDRYMLKLFRDYLFHSVTADGRPWLDHAHIVQSLNKLDAGTIERVQLMSRDEQSVLVVTYAELKNCLENAFSELIANASTTTQ